MGTWRKPRTQTQHKAQMQDRLRDVAVQIAVVIKNNSSSSSREQVGKHLIVHQDHRHWENAEGIWEPQMSTSKH